MAFDDDGLKPIDREWLEALERSPIVRGLRSKPRWCPYKLEDWRDEDPKDKRPRTPDGSNARANDKATWSTFDDAVSAALAWRGEGHERAGVGLMLGGLKGVLFLDLDDCWDDVFECWNDWAEELLGECASHSYVTPSGTGLRIVVKVPSDTKPMHLSVPRPEDGKLEAFHDTARFVTVLPGDGKLTDCPKELLDDLLSKRERQVDRETVASIDWDRGRHLPDHLADYPAKFREKLDAAEDDPGDRSETFNRLAWSGLASGLSPASVLEAIREHAPTVAEKYDGRQEAEFARCAAKFFSDREPDFDDLDPELLHEASRRSDRAIGDGDAATDPLLRTRVLDLQAALDDLVYLSQVAGVYDAKAGVSFKSWDLAAGHFAASKFSPEDGGRPVPVLPAWKQSQDRRTVQTLTWAPDRPLFCPDPEEGLDAVNTWKGFAPMDAPDDWRTVVMPFLDHVAYLIPVDEERERFLDWLAHMAQRPGELPHTAYLMITPERGIGRNWLASILVRAFRGNVASGVRMKELISDSFNGRLSQKVLFIVDETREGTEGKNRYRLANELQNTITQEHRLINPKYGAQQIQYNCARGLFFSNFYDALPFDKKDRRIRVIFNPTERRTEDYYSRLYALRFDTDFVASVRRFLEDRDISGFNPGEHAPMNEAKQMLLGEMQSEDEADLEDFMQDWKGPLCLRSDLEEALGVRGRRLGHILSEANAISIPKKRVNLDSSGSHKTGVVLLRPNHELNVASVSRMPPALIAEMCEEYRADYRAAKAAGDFSED